MQEGSPTALVLYALATSITPGPNNLMLMASGLNFGVRRTLPHVAGVVSGFAVLLLATGLGFTQVIFRLPMIADAMRLIMAAWVLWLAWRLATLPLQPLDAGDDGSSAVQGPSDGSAMPLPMGLSAAMLFQWVNPKAWMMVLGVLAVHVEPGSGWPRLVFITAVYAAVMLPCNLLWVLAGRQMRRWLGTPRRQRMFNVLAGIMLAGSLYPLFV